ncbi:DNA-binding transcriptional ArsR family regulator [Hamadaea flava]|uniref:ArsR/SmtB family transcription factor n=1 Tax=Hamadaea flava TaxID=1742688 RepID=A0ABV8LVF6_9ACTN|nr:winged helix-turn-helix domain-containing protein [Hamadaea flava]MCP2329103.1 DNA-binding transcriptional ArsR family regulator [Hamadaea flava]
MLRIHFTDADLGGVRLAPGADPLWEALLSQHQVTGGGPPVLRSWRRRTRSRLTPPMRTLLRLAPPTGYSPDFLTPTAGVRDIEASLEAVRRTSLDLVHADLGWMQAHRPPPGWVRKLADGDAAAMRGLTEAMREYFDAALAAVWPSVCGHVAAERAIRARAMADGGVRRLLATLHPAVRWEPPVLRVAYPEDRDLHLGGRGLVLLPSYFCWRTPVTLRAADRPPVLVYPIDHSADRHHGATPGNLTALVGATRAAVLRAALRHPHGCTTGDLARYAGISLSSASEHATVLRQAGLLRARPLGRHVLHVITELGRRLAGGGD